MAEMSTVSTATAPGKSPLSPATGTVDRLPAMAVIDAPSSEARDPERSDRVVADVPAALLAAKLAQPVPMAGLLPRSDVVAELVASPGKLILISAPAGWGKTSLLTAWLETEANERPFAFLRLEDGDDDAAVFWTYVIAALRTIHPGFMASEDEALRTPGMDPMRLVVPQLVNELGEIDEPIVLVLDDFHLTTQPSLHESVRYLVDHLPPKVCLVIATRADPPLPLGRLRASGEMTEIRSAQLALTPAETTRCSTSDSIFTSTPPASNCSAATQKGGRRHYTSPVSRSNARTTPKGSSNDSPEMTGTSPTT